MHAKHKNSCPMRGRLNDAVELYFENVEGSDFRLFDGFDLKTYLLMIFTVESLSLLYLLFIS